MKSDRDPHRDGQSGPLGGNLDQAQQLEVIEKLAILATPEEPERDRVDAGKKIKSLVPKAWAVAVPVLQSVLTAELRTKLGLPLD